MSVFSAKDLIEGKKFSFLYLKHAFLEKFKQINSYHFKFLKVLVKWGQAEFS